MIKKRNVLLFFYLIIIILIGVFCILSFSSCKGSFFSNLVKDKNNKETNLTTDTNQAELETDKKEETVIGGEEDTKEQKQQDYSSEEQSSKDSKEEDNAGQENSTEQIDISNQIIVTSPKPNQIIYSPLIIEGKAIGTWYFEADFPVKLLDANKNIIAEHYAQALGEWMTEDFVPFKSVIEFEKPNTERGILVLEKDNPAGLPEYDAKLEIPVIFGSKKY